MSFWTMIRNAFSLMSRGEWRELNFRLRVRLGQIDLKTSGPGDPDYSEERGYHYADSGGLHLEKILKTLNITSEDSIVDFGSGKGGVLFTFSKFPFAKITGCEVYPELAEIAKRNLKVMGVKNVSIVVADAADFKDLDGYNFFYFFNPFPADVMAAVVKNIVSSLSKKPRKVRLIYFNPECHDVIVKDTPFTKVGEYPQNGLKYHVYSNAI